MGDQIVFRMLSGEPFTYSDLAAVNAAAGGNEGEDRRADKTIQKWRRNGWIEMRGRRGRAPLWHLTPLGIEEAGAGAPDDDIAMYGQNDGDRRKWSADQLLEDVREELDAADAMGMQGNAGFYAALIDYIERHEAEGTAP